MSHPLSTTKSPSPHPVLQAALGSLDIQLEVELVLYRCHQAVRRLPPLADQVGQGQISKISNGTLLEKTEEAATTQAPKSTNLNLDTPISNSDSNSDITPSELQDTRSIELTSSLTLADYLEFSRAQSKKLETKASAKSRVPGNLLKLLAIAAVSLLLSIPLSYLTISLVVNSMGLNGIGSDCPVTERSGHFCNSSSLGNR